MPAHAPGDDAMKDAFIAFPPRQLHERTYGGGH